jgi:hypothetical protein
MYNGWLHAVFITGCFCYGASGLMHWCRHNFVGSWNDGDTSLEFQLKLNEPDKNLPGHGVLADSAFPVSDICFNRIITPLKENDYYKHSPQEIPFLMSMSNAITSMRQSCEWGVGAAEKCFRRLLMKLPFHPTKRMRRLNNILRLYNFRVRITGISQIRSYFFCDEE